MIETMSMEELKTYKGRQDAPENFDEFWLNELSKLPEEVDYTLEEKDFDFESAYFYELKFKGTKNSIIHCRYILPKITKKVPVIVNFHGYQGQSSDWTEGLKYSAAGYAFVTMDVRGQSGQSIDGGNYGGNTVKGHVVRGMVDGPENLFFKEVYLDVYQLVRLVSQFEQIDEEAIYTLGGSQGGALALIAAALVPEVKKVVSVYPFLSDFKRVLEFGNHNEPYDELFRYFKFKDPFHETEEQVLNTLSYIDVKNFASKINAEVLMLIGLEDEVCYPSTQFSIYNRLESQKNLLILPEYGHEGMHVEVNNKIYNFLVETTFKN